MRTVKTGIRVEFTVNVDTYAYEKSEESIEIRGEGSEDHDNEEE